MGYSWRFPDSATGKVSIILLKLSRFRNVFSESLKYQNHRPSSVPGMSESSFFLFFCKIDFGAYLASINSCSLKRDVIETTEAKFQQAFFALFVVAK